MKPFQRIIKQPNNYTCYPASLAMVLGITLDQCLLLFGHDGSDVYNPSLENPKNLRGFTKYEVSMILAGLGYLWMQVWTSVKYEKEDKTMVGVWPPKAVWNQNSFEKFIEGREGIIIVTSRNIPNANHAMAWNGDWVFDPEDGERKELKDFSVESFEWIRKCANKKIYPYKNRLKKVVDRLERKRPINKIPQSNSQT